VCDRIEGTVRYSEGKNKGTKYKNMDNESEQAIYTKLHTL